MKFKITDPALFSLFLSASVFANGGPVDWTGANPRGGIFPKDTPSIRLISEDLNLNAIAGKNNYSVEAKYLLENNEAEKEIQFGVPMDWTTDQSESADEYAPGALRKLLKGETTKASLKMKEISISLNNTDFPCTPAKGVFTKIKGIKVKAWCVSMLKIPATSQFSITLKYNASFWFSDSQFSKSALKTYSDRRLSYLLFPAGYWSGPLKSLHISVNLGELSEFATVSKPAGHKREKDTFVWNFQDVSLKDKSEIEITIDSEIFKYRDLKAWNKVAGPNEKIILKMSAENTLTDHESSKISDGDPTTAWCEGVKGFGEKSVLKFEGLNVGEVLTQYCNVEGLLFTPGYVKSQAVYEANPTIEKLSIAKCGSNEFRNVDMKSERNHLKAVEMIPLENEEVKCFNLRIDKIKKPKTPKQGEDTCISEVAAVVNCG